MKECSIENCNRKHHGKGYCKYHYQNYTRYGDPEFTKRVPNDGRSKLPEYIIYAKIKNRCYNENDHSYNRYGGRGIFMSDGWLKDFWSFYNDVGNRPTKKHQIDRIDNNKGYSKDNCRWVLPVVNARNRNNSFTENEVRQIRQMLGKQMVLVDIADKFGVDRTTIHKIKTNKHYKNYGVL